MVLLVCVVLSTHDWFMVSQGLKKKHTHICRINTEVHVQTFEPIDPVNGQE